MSEKPLYIPLLPFTGHAEVIISVLSPNETILATGSLDKTIRIWNLPDLNLMKVLDNEAGIIELKFIPDGKFLVAGS